MPREVEDTAVHPKHNGEMCAGRFHSRSLCPALACLNGASVTRTSSHSVPWAPSPVLDIVTTLRRSLSTLNVNVANCA
jgi:hypothetical protein